ncbi:MAG: hypothetical protein QNI95_11500 [Desulfobacterales bacterium]|nr:hypothetical protein [Desulfobacterales bacterium]
MYKTDSRCSRISDNIFGAPIEKPTINEPVAFEITSIFELDDTVADSFWTAGIYPVKCEFVKMGAELNVD